MISGYYAWTWDEVGGIPDPTLSIAFSGLADPQQAINESKKVFDRLEGEKYISLGGGGEPAGKWTKEVIQKIKDTNFSEYQGICLDIEVGDSDLTIDDFTSLISDIKTNKKMKVLVTISHSLPYGITNAAALMTALIKDSNIDYMSPQLYTRGDAVECDISSGYGWSEYKDVKALMVPSIPNASMYEAAKGCFGGSGVELSGYIQWLK